MKVNKLRMRDFSTFLFASFNSFNFFVSVIVLRSDKVVVDRQINFCTIAS